MNAAILLVCATGSMAVGQDLDTVSKSPLIQVRTSEGGDKAYRHLIYNRINIGRNYVKPANRVHHGNPERDFSRLPTTYFHDKSPIGIVFQKYNWLPGADNTYHADVRLPISMIGMATSPGSALVNLWSEPPVAVLGLDVGSLAAYARPAQSFHFTERVPAIVKLSLPDMDGKRHFHYVQDALDRGACLKIFEGEPREVFQMQAGDGFYQMIVVETYKLPVSVVHKELFTKEAMQLLMTKVREDGIVCYHTTSRFYNLSPIVASAARELGYACLIGIDSPPYDDANSHRFSSDWVMVARSPKHLTHLKPPDGYKLDGQRNSFTWSAPKLIDKRYLWTDKGAQSFRGLYFSDPDIECWHDVVSDFAEIATEHMGVPDELVEKITRPMSGLIHLLSRRSADELNGESPAPPEKKPEELEKDKDTQVKPKSTASKGDRETLFQAPLLKVKREVDRWDKREFPRHMILFNQINIGYNYRKPAEREDYGQPDIDQSRLATTYFHREGPVGRVMEKFNWNSQGKPNTYHADARLPASLVWSAALDPYAALVNLWSEPPVAVIDMDVGTMASYARPTQTMHFFEENPSIVKFSLPDKGKERYFDFVHDALDRGANIKVFEGEPRATVEKEAGAGFYHVIVINTYKLPVVTVHKDLMTREGMKMLMEKTVPEGVLCYHTSSRYYGLDKIIASVAAELKYACIVGHDMNDDHQRGHFTSEWVMVARKAEYLKHLVQDAAFLDRYDRAIRNKRGVGERYWLDVTDRANKKFVWTDNEKNSFKGIYHADPDIGEFQMTLYELQDLIADHVGPADLHRYMEPFHRVLLEWSFERARILNGETPAPPKKKPEKTENEKNIEIKTYLTKHNGKQFPYDLVLFHRTVVGANYHKPQAREDIGKPDADFSRLATTYYHPHSPVGIPLQKFNWFPGPRNTFDADVRLPASMIGLGNDSLSQLVNLWSEPPIAVIGLEVGTLASYARPTQSIHFFARVPEFVKMSLPDEGQPPRFHYVRDALDRGAALRIFEGELRQTFEEQAGDGFYHLISIDIYREPDHNILKDLITREAMQVYMRKLSVDGVLCFHVSSRHYDLVPIIASAAKELDYTCMVGRYHDDREDSLNAFSAEWVVVARKTEHLAHLKAPPGYTQRVKEPYWKAPPLVDKFFVWSDKGENSLRGVYRSDPAVDQLRWVWNDFRFWIHDQIGGNSRELFQYTRWIDDLFWAWTSRSADIMNRGAPVARKEKN